MVKIAVSRIVVFAVVPYNIQLIYSDIINIISRNKSWLYSDILNKGFDETHNIP